MNPDPSTVARPSSIRPYVLTIPPGGTVELPVTGNFYRITRASVSVQLVVKSEGYPDDNLPGERGFGMVTGGRIFNRLSVTQSPYDTSPRDVPYQVEVLAGYKNAETVLFFSN